MAGFGGGVWGGPGGGATTIGVPVGTLILPAYRIAGITKRAMITPSPDMFAEAIPELSRMLGTWNCARPKIFTIAINDFPISGGQKVFTIGPGADFDMARPQSIQDGVIVLSTTLTNAVRMPPMQQMDDKQWAQVSLQDVPNGVPLAFYYDGSFDPSTGWANIYLWPQTLTAYRVEWYTWQALTTFATKDDVVALPPGYESAIVFQLAARLAALNPNMANMAPRSYDIARDALAAIEHKNATSADMTSDYPGVRRGHYDYRIGSVRI